MSEQLRQPITFWQWLSGQPGTLIVPPEPLVPRSAMAAIETELQRIHEQIDSLRDEGVSYLNGAAGTGLVAKLDKLHEELTRRSKDETLSTRQS